MLVRDERSLFSISLCFLLPFSSSAHPSCKEAKTAYKILQSFSPTGIHSESPAEGLPYRGQWNPPIRLNAHHHATPRAHSASTPHRERG